MSNEIKLCARHNDSKEWGFVVSGEYRAPSCLNEICEEIVRGNMDWFEYKQGNIVYRFMREVDLSVAIKYGVMKFVSLYKR